MLAYLLSSIIRHVSVSTVFSLRRYINLEYVNFNIFYSIVLLNHVSPSQPGPRFRDWVGVLVPLSNILLIMRVDAVVFLCTLPISGSDKTVFPPILHTRLKTNFKHSCCLIMNIAYLSYIVFLGYQCVAPGLLFCFVTQPDRRVCCYEVIKRYLYFGRYCCLALCR